MQAQESRQQPACDARCVCTSSEANTNTPACPVHEQEASVTACTLHACMHVCMCPPATTPASTTHGCPPTSNSRCAARVVVWYRVAEQCAAWVRPPSTDATNQACSDGSRDPRHERDTRSTPTGGCVPRCKRAQELAGCRPVKTLPLVPCMCGAPDGAAAKGPRSQAAPLYSRSAHRQPTTQPKNGRPPVPPPQHAAADTPPQQLKQTPHPHLGGLRCSHMQAHTRTHARTRARTHAPGLCQTHVGGCVAECGRQPWCGTPRTTKVRQCQTAWSSSRAMHCWRCRSSCQAR
jgi:hypothetical protein